MEELVAAVRQQRRQRPNRAQDRRGNAAAGPGAEGGPRKCPNCGEDAHVGGRCPHPPVAVKDRVCWNCKKKRHTSAACPDRKKPGSVRSVEPAEGPAASAKVVFAVDKEWYTRVGPKGKPVKTQVTLGDFLCKDLFRGIKAVTPGDASVPQPSPKAPEEPKHWTKEIQ